MWGEGGGGNHTAGQGILEDLLEAQEFENGQVHGRMKAQSSLVRPQCGIELHAISPIDLNLALVIFPDDAELNHSLGHGSNFQSGLVFRVLGEKGGVLEGGHKFYGFSQP